MFILKLIYLLILEIGQRRTYVIYKIAFSRCLRTATATHENNFQLIFIPRVSQSFFENKDKVS